MKSLHVLNQKGIYIVVILSATLSFLFVNALNSQATLDNDTYIDKYGNPCAYPLDDEGECYVPASAAAPPAGASQLEGSTDTDDDTDDDGTQDEP